MGTFIRLCQMRREKESEKEELGENWENLWTLKLKTFAEILI